MLPSGQRSAIVIKVALAVDVRRSEDVIPEVPCRPRFPHSVNSKKRKVKYLSTKASHGTFEKQWALQHYMFNLYLMYTNTRMRQHNTLGIYARSIQTL